VFTVAPDHSNDASDDATGSSVSSASPSGSSGSLLDELVREGARRMLAAALEAEVAAYVDAHKGEVDELGRRLVVRNGHHAPRSIVTGAGAVEVVAPRVNDKRTDEASGERRRFCSAILPPWCHRPPKVSEVLPLLYLHGLSGNDFTPALEQFLGTSAGLSAATVTRLTTQWQDEARAFAARDLRGVDYVYCWADGVHVNVRLEEERLCLLALIGVRTDGTKELVALADGYRESEGSWADLLRDARRRGMRAPVLAVGDGALGFWAALGEVFPQTRVQRCWFHKIGNVLAALPKSAHPGAKKALDEIWNAEDKQHAHAAVKAFAATYGAKWPKAVAKVTGDEAELLAFYDFPAEHWIHRRTTDEIVKVPHGFGAGGVVASRRPGRRSCVLPARPGPSRRCGAACRCRRSRRRGGCRAGRPSRRSVRARGACAPRTRDGRRRSPGPC